MKKRMMLIAVVLATIRSVFGVERISVDEVTNHYPWDGKVDCVCTLSGLESGCVYQGAFTLTVKKEGSTVRRVITNDFAAADGTYTYTFDTVALFGVGLYQTGGIAVELVKERKSDGTGDPIGVVGDVLIIDISAGSTAASYPTKELTGVDIGTFNCDDYKKNKIVLRKIPKGAYYCEPGATNTVSRRRITNGFYIGVFPVTQQQYKQVMGTNPSSFRTDAEGNVAAQRPVESVSWNTIRGGEAAGTAITASSEDSFLKRLVAKTGLSGFDLPTEAQWEMACRAGATAEYGAYWNGREAVELASSNLVEAAWHYNNSSSMTHAVGGRKPNSWGLYDMQGNVWEWCRDVFISTYSTDYVDTPCTDTSSFKGIMRVLRGGCWENYATNCRPSFRSRYNYNQGRNTDGFRLSRALP